MQDTSSWQLDNSSQSSVYSKVWKVKSYLRAPTRIQENSATFGESYIEILLIIYIDSPFKMKKNTRPYKYGAKLPYKIKKQQLRSPYFVKWKKLLSSNLNLRKSPSSRNQFKTDFRDKSKLSKNLWYEVNSQSTAGYELLRKPNIVKANCISNNIDESIQTQAEVETNDTPLPVRIFPLKHLFVFAYLPLSIMPSLLIVCTRS